MEGYKFNKEGDLIPIDVYIVWGSPASGKTTYVRQNMEDGDLVVDLDFIKQSISLKDKTDTGDNLLGVAIKIRDRLYEIIRARELECRNVWVVAGLPIAADRQRLENYLQATKMIRIEATKEQCIERAFKDKERKDKDKQIKIIEKWFEQFYAEQ